MSARSFPPIRFMSLADRRRYPHRFATGCPHHLLRRPCGLLANRADGTDFSTPHRLEGPAEQSNATGDENVERK